MVVSREDRVRWNWSAGEGEGVVQEVRADRMERQIDGATIVRNGVEDNPACLIRPDDGSEVLKRVSELHSP